MELSEKTAFLLALGSFWRPRSDLARSSLDNLKISKEGITIVAIQPKEADYKQTFVSRCSIVEICPVHTLEIYLQRTAEARSVNHTSQIFISNNKPHKAVSADTIGRWISNLLKKTGISARAHSTRGVATSFARELGIDEKVIMEKANWKSFQTFKGHYQRPTLNRSLRVNVVNDVHSRINEPLSVTFIKECTSSRSELEVSHPDPTQRLTNDRGIHQGIGFK
jgi:hypothetical protein